MKNQNFNLNYGKFVGITGDGGLTIGTLADELETDEPKIEKLEMLGVDTNTDVLKGKTKATVAKNKEKIGYLKDKEGKEAELIENYRKDKKINALKERGETILDPKDLAAIEIEDKKIMKETRLLLMLIEKYLPGNDKEGIELSSRLYQKACTRDAKGKFKSIDLSVLRDKFIGWPNSDERGKKEPGFKDTNGSSAIKELGFYYLSEPRSVFVDDGDKDAVFGFIDINKRGVLPAGWYTWDNDSNSEDEYHGKFLSLNLHRKNAKAPSLSRRPGIALYKGMPSAYNDGEGIIKELEGTNPKKKKGETDSGLEASVAIKLANDIRDLDKQNREIARSGLAEGKYKKMIFKGFQKGFEKFAVPSNNVKTSKDAKNTKKGAAPFSLMSSLNMLFKGKASKFQYRYMPEHNRVYCLSFDKKTPDAYIEMNNNTGRAGEWVEYTGEGNMEGRSLSKDLFKDMKVEQFEKEYLLANVKSKNINKIDKNDQLGSTQDMLAALPTNKKNKSFPYNKLEDHLILLEKELIQKLKKKFPHDNNKVETLAKIRIDDIRTKVKAKVDGDETLTAALEKKPNFRMKMRINSDGTVNVEIAEKPKFLNDIKKKIKDGHDAGVETAESFEDTMGAAIGAKYPGFMGEVIKWFIGEDGMKKKSFMTSAILSFLGIKGFGSLKDGFLSRKVNQEVFDKLLKKKDKEKKIKKKLVFDKPVKLTGKKIIIPKGKGLKLGGALKIELKGAGKVSAAPLKEKKKGKFKNPFAKGKAQSQYQYKEHEIIIHPSSGSNQTIIPAGTEIPRGAKIVRI